MIEILILFGIAFAALGFSLVFIWGVIEWVKWDSK